MIYCRECGEELDNRERYKGGIEVSIECKCYRDIVRERDSALETSADLEDNTESLNEQINHLNDELSLLQAELNTFKSLIL